MIAVTLLFRGREMDVLIPSSVTIGRLKQLLREMFAKNGSSLPEEVRIVAHHKNIQLGDYDKLADFGIATGDILEIQIGE